MAGTKETEIKFRIADLKKLARSLKKAGFRLVTRSTHEMNTLYDLPGGRLRKKGELLRLRQYGEEWVLTHKAKGTTGQHKTRVESETRVENGKQTDALLQALGYRPGFRYEKFRAEWSDGKGHVVVDETPIGHFGEIEGQPRWINATARALEIVPENYITETYAGLFFAWKHKTKSPATEMTFREVRRGTKRSS